MKTVTQKSLNTFFFSLDFVNIIKFVFQRTIPLGFQTRMRIDSHYSQRRNHEINEICRNGIKIQFLN